MRQTLAKLGIKMFLFFSFFFFIGTLSISKRVRLGSQLFFLLRYVPHHSSKEKKKNLCLSLFRSFSFFQNARSLILSFSHSLSLTLSLSLSVFIKIRFLANGRSCANKYVVFPVVFASAPDLCAFAGTCEEFLIELRSDQYGDRRSKKFREAYILSRANIIHFVFI